MKRQRAPQKSKCTWSRIIKEYLSSGLSKEAFCNNKKIHLQTFKGWYSRLNPKKIPRQVNQVKKSGFIPVTVTPKTSHAGVSVELPNGIKLAFFDVPFDGDKLKELLRICCDVVNG